MYAGVRSADVNREPLVSCLCVTQDRAAFMPWLFWGFRRQTWQNRELVIVDSSAQCTLGELPAGVRLIRARPGAGVAEKRNLALEAAGGELIAWFDDDDWQHPRRLDLLVAALGEGACAAGPTEGFFVDLWTQRCRRYVGSELVFNGALFQRDLARSERFDPGRVRGSDTVWLRALSARHGAAFRRVPGALFFWLVHEQNLSNPRTRRPCWTPIASLEAHVGAEAFGDTALELERLRVRLGTARAAARASARATPRPAANSSSGRGVPGIIGSWSGGGRSFKTPPPVPAPSKMNVVLPPGPPSSIAVSALIKATVLDVPYLETMARHMLAQAKFRFADRLLVIDPRLDFTGKYRGRQRFERAALDAAVSRLIAGGVIDRVLEVPYDQPEVSRVLGRYFRGAGPRVPTHAVTGGPVYPTLFGLESVGTDFVVQFDGDMFFHVPGQSWIEAGLSLLARHRDVWFVMLHGGPPRAPDARVEPARSNSLYSSWDEQLAAWRFPTVSTRYFLTDRRRLRGRVPAVRRGAGIMPLEQCFSAGLQRERAVRIGLPSAIGWDLHAHSHAHPFAAWASGIAELVRRGIVPDAQRGSYDLRLDRPAPRGAWERTLSQYELLSPLAAAVSAPSTT